LRRRGDQLEVGVTLVRITAAGTGSRRRAGGISLFRPGEPQRRDLAVTRRFRALP
jgi:hypothetical protein